MERVYRDEMWSLFCPHQSPGLHECHGDEFVRRYAQYEREGRFVRQVRARDLWTSILESQIETGTPYMCYKDACNAKSNQRHLGTISSSNLCTEIIQYTSPEEVAVCNLASLCLASFVRTPESDRTDGELDSSYGSPLLRTEVDAKDHHGLEGGRWFDHAALHGAVKTVTRNLNKIIDINHYPIPEASDSNLLHRPIGIGVSGLADTFVRLGYAFGSEPAKQLNRAIFETMYHAALEASAELAERDGWYPSFPGSPASFGELQHHLWGMTDDETPSRQFFSYPSLAGPDPHGYDTVVASQSGYNWEQLRRRIRQTGLRNSLLLAPMPTASTSQILGVNECFEPFSSNLYVRRVKAGEFIYANPHLLNDLMRLGLWTTAVRNQLMRDGGSVQNIAEIPQEIKDLYRTVWEISMKDIIDMAADRGRFVDQSQSLNLFMADPTLDKLTAMHFYAWRKGLKTGMYYLRTKPAVNAIQYTVHKEDEEAELIRDVRSETMLDGEACLSCSS
jgi:ribonucleoside-diphosphate reductase alpha subunit